MAVQRKKVPLFVQWDQQSILRRIGKLEDALTVLISQTTTPSSDTEGIVVRNVRDHEILEGQERITEILERIQFQLSFMTGVTLEVGDLSG